MNDRTTSSSPPTLLDFRGYRCPLPVVKLEAALRAAAPGAAFLVFADDPVAAVDIPHACTQGANPCERLADRADQRRASPAGGGRARSYYVFRVTRGENPA
ncbi:MAG: sulfurtransferase TusA family protein [Pseudomonadota bacterium]